MLRLELIDKPFTGRVDVLEGPLVEDADQAAAYACGRCGNAVLEGRDVREYMGRFAISCPCGALNATAVAR